MTSSSVLVVSDTHLTAATLDRMPPEVWALAEQADLVLHAGDVVDPAVLERFEAIAPTLAVLGNNDLALVGQLPETRELTVGEAAVAMVHDAGPTAGRHRRMARRFPGTAVVLFGHSHQPLVEREAGGPLLVNPGSPTQRRRQPVHTVAWLDIDGGEVEARLREVGPLASPSASR